MKSVIFAQCCIEAFYAEFHYAKCEDHQNQSWNWNTFLKFSIAIIQINSKLPEVSMTAIKSILNPKSQGAASFSFHTKKHFRPYNIQHNDIQHNDIQHNNKLNMTLSIMILSTMVECVMLSVMLESIGPLFRRHDTQHNNTQHYNIQHIGIQHNDTQHNVAFFYAECHLC